MRRGRLVLSSPISRRRDARAYAVAGPVAAHQCGAAGCRTIPLCALSGGLTCLSSAARGFRHNKNFWRPWRTRDFGESVGRDARNAQGFSRRGWPWPRVGLQMDQIADIDIVGDTSFACAGSAGAGMRFFYEPDRLAMRDGAVSAAIQPLKVADKVGAHYELGAPILTDLRDLDVILMAGPRDVRYISATHMRARASRNARSQ